MEGLFGCMLMFLALKLMLQHKDDDMGKRGKRKRKFQHIPPKEAEAIEVMSKSKKKDKEDNRKPFERITLPPPREAQPGHY